jgi:hypothetical protein
MDDGTYNPLLDALQDGPDPPQARGKRHAWRHLFMIIVAGLTRQHQSAHAMAHRAPWHATARHAALPAWPRLPSASTSWHVLRRIAGMTGAHQLARCVAGLPRAGAASSSSIRTGEGPCYVLSLSGT